MPNAAAAWKREFSRIHADLRRGAGARAAQAIVALLKSLRHPVAEHP